MLTPALCAQTLSCTSPRYANTISTGPRRHQCKNGGVSDNHQPPPGTYPGRAIIDLAAISQNVSTLATRLGDNGSHAAIMAVVKANAYGHGLVPAARAALHGGATWLGVAHAHEALALRQAGITDRILTWLHAPGVPYRDLIAADIDVSVAAPWAAQEVISAAQAAGRPARVHLKVDTGLGRNGVTPADLPFLLATLIDAQHAGHLTLVGVWSHLAFADEPHHPSVREQARVFDDAITIVQAAGAHLEVRHIANSAATLTAPELAYDLVRPGLAIYGLSPIPQVASAAELGLRPAMTVQADIATAKRLPAGHGVSYAHHYVTARDTHIAVIPLGYADGIPRHASGHNGELGAPVSINGVTYAIAGRVCMDQIVIDVHDDSVRAGHTATLFGDPTLGVPSAQQWADATGTISYEITTRIADRLPRMYLPTSDLHHAPTVSQHSHTGG